MVIDLGSPDWPRKQAADLIREKIEMGEWTQKLPPIMRLAEQLGIAPKTVERALDILKAEGLVYGVPGRGTFIRTG